jgi:hypothetical protein
MLNAGEVAVAVEEALEEQTTVVVAEVEVGTQKAQTLA